MTSRRSSSRGSPLRLVLVAGCRFPSPRGSQVLIDQMARSLATTGAEVHLVARGDASRRMAGYRFHAVRGGRGAGPELAPSRPAPLTRGAAVWRVARATLAVVEAVRAHVVHAHNFEGLAAALLARRLGRGSGQTPPPVVFHCHGLLSDELPLASSRAGVRGAQVVGHWVDGTVPHLADRVVALSSDVARHLEADGLAREKLEVIAPGLIAGGFPDGERGERLSRVVFSGNLDAYQNLDLLLDAWEQVQPRERRARLRLAVHATGRATRRLQRQVSQRAIAASVDVIPVSSLAAAMPELLAARVGVSPRTSWSGFPIKHLNYMAAGLPTVAMASAGKGVVAGRNGALVEPGRPDLLAGAILHLLADERACRDLGQGGRELVVEEHCPALWGRRLLASSEAALGQERPGGMELGDLATARAAGLAAPGPVD